MIGEFCDCAGSWEHELAARWWLGHHPGVQLHPRVLSKYVAMVSDIEPLAMMYLYPCHGSELCYLGFTVRNPELSAYKAGRALHVLFDTAHSGVKLLGKSVIISGFDSPALQNLAVKKGYVGGSLMKEYWRF